MRERIGKEAVATTRPFSKIWNANPFLMQTPIIMASTTIKRFIPRVFVVRNVESDESRRERREISREMEGLLETFDYVRKHAPAYRAHNRAMRAVEKEKRERMLRPACELRLYAAVASEFACSEGVQRLLHDEVVIPFVPTWRRSELRRDYSDAFKCMQAERSAAYELACAIANRHAVVKRTAKGGVSFVERKELKEARRALNRERRFQRRHVAGEVESFPLGCFQAKPVVEPVRSITPEVRGVARSTSVKQTKVRAVRPLYEDTTDKARSELPKLSRTERFSVLVQKLGRTTPGRMLIAFFLQWKASKDTYRPTVVPRRVSPQGDIEPVAANPIAEIDKSSNVALLSLSNVDRALPIIRPNQGQAALAAASELQVNSTSLERWTPVQTFVWKSSDLIEVPLYQQEFPNELWKKKFENQPIMQVLRMHRYMRSGLEFRAQINSNRFQVGQLMLFWTYGERDQVEIADYRYLTPGSSRICAYLNAGSNNDASLIVPYRRATAQMRPYRDSLGWFSILVMNPLVVTEGVSNACSVTIYVRLAQSEVTGMIDRSLTVPQMDTIGALCNAGSNLLSTIGRDFNRDNPPAPIQPMAFIPHSSNSFAYMTGVPEPVNMLRADPRGQTPHFDTEDEMALSKLVTTEAYLTTFEWKVSHAADTQVWSMPAVPLMKRESYRAYRIAPGSEFFKRAYPPLAVAASLFGLWRGDINLRFQVVGTAFHTGRLCLSVVPGRTEADVDAFIAKASPNSVVDIVGSTEFEFIIPFYWYNAWAVTQGIENDGPIPSTFYIHVVNPLISVDSVSPTIYVNVFISGGTNFELSLPRLPMLAPTIGPIINPPKTQVLTPYNMESAWYVTWEHGLVRPDGGYAQTVYIQNISKGWVGYLNLTEFIIYKLLPQTSTGMSFRCEFGSSAFVYFGVYDPELSTTSAHGLVVFNRIENAKTFVKVAREKGYLSARAYAPKWEKDGPWSQVKRGGKWVTATNSQDEGYPLWEAVSSAEEGGSVSATSLAICPSDDSLLSDDGEPQIGEPVRLDNPVGTTSMGLLSFGEQTPDLKSLCRRWALYTSLAGNTCNQRFPRDCVFFAKVPVHPVRVLDTRSSGSYDNRARHGTIGLVSSAYYLWRGSLRYRFVAIGDIPEGATIYVQHRFDEVSTSSSIVVYGRQVLSVKDMMSTQYATSMQVLSVNAALSVEVPYYQPQDALYLTPGNSMENWGNGYLYVWVHAPVKQSIRFEVYHSLADDARFSTWQGFPLLMDLTEIGPEPQGDDAPASSDVIDSLIALAEKLHKDDQPKEPKTMDIKSTIKPTKASLGVEESTSSGWNPLGSISSWFNAPKVLTQNSAEITTKVAEASEKFQETTSRVNKILDSFSGVVEKLNSLDGRSSEEAGTSNILSTLSSLGGKVFDFMAHIIYAIISPCAATCAFALVNIYRRIWGFTGKGFDQLVLVVKDLYFRAKKLWNKQESTEQPQVEPQGEDTLVPQYAGLLFTVIASACKISAKATPDLSGVGMGLFEFSDACRRQSFVVSFLKDNLSFFQRVYHRFLGLFGFSCPDYAIYTGEDPKLVQWLSESTALTLPHKRDEIHSSPIMAQKVIELCMLGRALTVSLANAKVPIPSHLFGIVKERLKELLIIEKELIQRKTFSSSRYEPYCLWASGEAGAGKSTFCQKVAAKLSVGGLPYHTMTAGQKYFDGYSSQSTIFMDDAFTLGISADPESYAQFLQMKSCALFNPPYAKVEDKDRYVNFSNLLVTSNRSFIDNMAGILDDEAFNRRRDTLLHFKLRPEVDKSKKLRDQFSNEELDELIQADVSYIPDTKSKNIQSAVIIPREPGVPYSETVMKFVLDEAKRYHEREAGAYAARCADFQKSIDAIAASSLEEYLESVKKLMFAPDSTVKSFVKRMISAMRPIINAEPQGDDRSSDSSDDEMTKLLLPLTWPHPDLRPCRFREYTDLDEAMEESSDYYIEPFQRSCIRLAPSLATKCRHEIFDYECAAFHPESQVFYSKRITASSQAHMSQSAPSGPCFRFQRKEDGRIVKEIHPDCMWASKSGRGEFLLRFYEGFRLCNLAIMREVRETIKSNNSIKFLRYLPAGLWDLLMEAGPIAACKGEPNFARTNDEELKLLLEDVHAEIKTDLTVIDGIAVSNEPPSKTWTRKLWDSFKNMLRLFAKAICIVIAVAGTILAGVGWFGLMRSSNIVETFSPEPHIVSSGDRTTIRNARSQRMRAFKLANQGVDIQIVKDLMRPQEEGSDIVHIKKHLANNMVILAARTSEGLTYRGRCLGLFNKTVLVLKHYIELFEKSGATKIYVVRHKGTAAVEFDIKDIKFQWVEGTGYGLATLPNSFPGAFKDVRKYMPSEKFDQCYPRQTIIYQVDLDDITEIPILSDVLKDPLQIPACPTSSAWTISQGFSYKWGGKGKCGSLLLAPTMSTPLIGIHTAGVSTVTGYSEVLFKDTFIPEKSEPAIRFVSPQLDDPEEALILDGEYVAEGKLSSEMIPFASNETRIVPSVISGVFGVKTVPAPLSRRDPRAPVDPFTAGVVKRVQKVREFDPEHVQWAARDLFQKLALNVVPLRTLSPLSIKQAIEGIPGIPGYEKMELTTSEGFPWVKVRPSGAKDKSWLFQTDVYPDGRIKLTGIHPDLKEILDEKQAQRESLEVPATYYVACLKDSRVSIEKSVKPGATRIFEISPVELTIAQRQYYLDFDAAYSQARFEAENTIGINCDGPEWTQLAQMLTTFSPHILTADYSGYGPRLNRNVLMQTFDITSAWYEEHSEVSDEEWCVRETLKHEIAEGLHVAKNLVFRPTAGLPSGNTETVVRNSLANSLYIRIAYLGLALKQAPHYADFYWFEQFVLLFHNGDDLIMAVKPGIIEWFNNRTLIEFFAQYDIKMTDALKSGIVREYCSLEEATYLKRGFLPHPTRRGQWLAPLESDSITDTANWIWKSVDDEGSSLINSEMSARLAYTRGPEFYNNHVATIAAAWADRGRRFCFPGWDSLDKHVWDGTDGPRFSF